MNDPKASDLTNLDTQIVITDGFIATSPCTKATIDIADMNAGFRPMESNRDPTAGEIIISVSAALAARVDKVDVARSDPIASMRAGAGENATKAEDATVKKDDARKIIMSLRVQDSDEDDGGRDNATAVDLSFFKTLVCPFFLLLIVETYCIDFLFCVVDPPRTKMDFAVGLLLMNRE